MSKLTLGVIGTSKKEDERRVPIHPEHLPRVPEDIRRQLIDVQPLGEPEFVMLAKGRAENTKEAIVEVDASLQDRIFVRQSKAVARDSDEMIRMKVSISTED